jgi:hypothetical protein
MQPEDPFNPQPPAPDLPDAALPSISPIDEQATQSPIPPPQPQYQQPLQPQPPQYQQPLQYQQPPQYQQPLPSQPPQPPAPNSSINPVLPQQPPASQQSQEPSGNGTQGQHLLSSIGKKFFKFVEFDDQEILLAEIRKHPFGLLVIFLTGGIIAFVLLLGVTAVASSDFLTTLGFANGSPIIVFIGFLLSLFILAATLINAHLYRNNVVFVTNEKLAQILFITLFNRKLSQLSIGDIQDVTVQQNGFIPNLVGYGTLVVETAGEQQNYTFTFVPKPYETSKIIISAHESSIRHYGN